MICVTGGSGFFGIALVKRLLDEGEQVRVLDREMLDEAIKARVDFRQTDIRNEQAVMEGLEGCDVVYHNAAVVPISRAGSDFWSINHIGTENILKAAKKHGARRVLFYSTSSSLYGIPDKLPVTEQTQAKPIGDYGNSKHAAEEACRRYRAEGLNVSIVRPRTIVGPGRLGIFQILFEWIRTGSHVYLINGGKNRLQLIGLDDLVTASSLLRKKGDNEDFNIGTDRYQTLREDLETLIKHAGTASSIISIPGWLARCALTVLDWLHLSPFVDLHYKTIDKDFYFDVTKAKTMLGWTPKQSNADCLIAAYDWYLAHHEKIDKDFGSTHRKAVRKRLISMLK